jgi:O-antigen/teichoic acid export membrane protein
MAIRTVLGRARASELGGLAGDSFHVGIWQVATAAADLAQIALVTHVLGLHQYGRLALVMSFVVLVGQFFDVRIGAAATTFGANRLHEHDIEGAAGVFQLAYLVDLCTGAVAFALVAGLAPLAGGHLVGNRGTTLVVLFAATLLISTGDETSITILRLLDRFKLIAVYTTVLQAGRIALVAAAVFVWHSILAVVVVLVVFDLASALANALVASLVFRSSARRSVFRPALNCFCEKRRMLRMAFHTNVVSYARLTQVQLPTVLVGAISGATDVGILRVGTAAGTIIGRLSDPAYAAVLPRLARLWAEGRVETIRRMIRRASLIAGSALGIATVVLILLREPILRVIGGDAAASKAGTVLILVGIAQLVNGAVFWNVGLLFAAHRAGSVSLIAVGSALIQVAFLVPLVISYGANGAAAALLISMLLSNGAATLLGMRKLAAEAPHETERSKEALCAE